MVQTTIRVAWSTAPDCECALSIARVLVGDGLAACVNVISGLTSVYRWQGAIETDDEFLLIIKTRADRLDALRDRLLELHPYDVPEFLVVPVEGGSADYLRWVAEESSG